MPGRPDETLDRLILALVRMKVDTPYRLMKEASISLGASTGAINRLEKKGLITKRRGKTGRERIELRLTALGREILATPFELKSASPEFESAVRYACILYLQGKPKAAAEVVEELADRRLQDLPDETLFKRGAGLYRWMLQSCDRSRRKAEHVALREIARKLVVRK